MLAAGKIAGGTRKPIMQARKQLEHFYQVAVNPTLISSPIGAEKQILADRKRSENLAPFGDLDKPKLDDLVRRPAAQLLAVELDRAGADIEQPRQRQQRGRLAGAIGAEQGDDLSQLKGEADASDRFDGAIAHQQIFNVKQRAHNKLYTGAPSSALSSPK